MIPSIHERTILLFNFSIGAIPNEAPRVPLEQIVTILQRMLDEGKAFELRDAAELATDNEDEAEAIAQPTRARRQRAAETRASIREAEAALAVLDRPALITEQTPARVNALILRDLSVESDGSLVLFFQASDADGTNPAFLKPTTGKIRIVEPEAGEANAYSAHMVIGPMRRQGVYRAALERMPSLSRSAVIRFLNKLIRIAIEAEKHQWVFVDPERNERTYRPRLDSTLQMSRQLSDDLNENVISAIELVGEQIEKEFDEFDQVKAVRRRLLLKVVSDKTGGNAIDWLNRFLLQAKALKYDRMDIKLKKIVSGQLSSARLATDLENAAEAVYARNEIINGFDQELEQCWASIHEQTLIKIKALLQSDSLWN